MPAARNKWFLLLWMLLVLGGCSFVDKSNTIEEISPVVLLYLEEGNDGSIKLSTIIPPLKKIASRHSPRHMGQGFSYTPLVYVSSYMCRGIFSCHFQLNWK